MADWGFAPFAVNAYDNLETIRLRQYVTGAHFVLRGTAIETGRTPRKVVWEKGKVRLSRYGKDDEMRFAVPVLLVYALILRPYVLDLVPGNSLVEYLVDGSFDVYLLDWGVPDGEDSDLSFENYVLDYMPEAVDRVLATSGAGGLTFFGYCQGGRSAVGGVWLVLRSGGGYPGYPHDPWRVPGRRRRVGSRLSATTGAGRAPQAGAS